MATFYDISERYNNLLDLLNNPEVEFSLIESALNEVNEEFNDKADNIARLIRDINYDVDALKSEEKRLAERRKALENRQRSLKDYLENNMRSVGKDKFKTTFFSYNIQNNPPSLEVLDETLIPDSFIKVEEVRNIDKKALLAELKNGNEISGCQLKIGQSLRIR